MAIRSGRDRERLDRVKHYTDHEVTNQKEIWVQELVLQIQVKLEEIRIHWINIEVQSLIVGYCKETEPNLQYFSYQPNWKWNKWTYLFPMIQAIQGWMKEYKVS